MVSGSDNCTPVSYYLSQNTFDVQDALNSPVTIDLTGTDDHGNSTTVPVQVTVIDPVPTAIAQDITVELDNTGNITITPEQVDNGSNSVVGIQSLTLDNDMFDCSNIGDNTVILTVTSTLGATATATATVTVEDNIPPVVVTQNVSVDLDATGNASITAADVDDGSSDACGIASMSVSPAAFSCANVGANTVTLTVTDVNGNSNTANATVTVNDVTPPTVVAQNISVDLDASGNATITAAEVDNGSSDVCEIESMSVSPAAFTCADVGTNTVTLTVTDVNGNSATGTATATVNDVMPPAVVTQNISVDLDASGNASITAAEVDNGSSDACGIASMSVSPAAFTCTDVGTNTVTLTVTDVNGNFNTANATVTVNDVMPPAVVTQNISVDLDASGNASISAGEVDNGSSDACGITSMSVSSSSFTCADVGTNTVILTVTDVNGNSNTANATVTVNDVAPPAVVIQNISVDLDASGNASISAGEVDNGSSDACGIASMSVSPSSFTCADVGTNTVTLTVTDVNGNSNTANATVTINDVTPPAVVIQNISVDLDASGNASISAGEVDNGSSDACGIASMSVSPSSFTCADVGTNTVTLTVTDVNGNSNTANATVTINDVTPPTVVTQNITVGLDENGQATITPEQVDDGSTDNCEIKSLSLSKTSFDCGDVNSVQNSGYAVSFSGNGEYVQVGSSPVLKVSSALSIEAWVYPTGYNSNDEIIVSKEGEYELALFPDGTLRWAIANSDPGWAWVNSNQIIPLNQWSHITFVYNGVDAKLYINGTLAFSYGTSGAIGDQFPGSDDFRIGNRQFGGLPFIGRIDEVRVWNTVLTETQIQNQYNKKLVGTEPGLQGYWSFDEGTGSTTADLTQNGNNGNLTIPSMWISPGALQMQTTSGTSVILTVTDVNGNSNSASATVTVVDNILPTVQTQPATIYLNANGEASITVADIDNSSFDNCGIASLSLNNTDFTCADVGANTVTLTAVDVNGNSNSATATVTVVDDILPTVQTQPATIYLNANGEASITVADIDNSSFDNCGIASLSLNNTDFTCADVGANTVTLTAVDVNGNSNSATATVTVVDDILPTVQTQPATIYLNANGEASITVAMIDNNSFDNCGIASLSLDNTDFTCADVGANTVTLTAVDVNGNSNSATATVTVVDDILPTVQTQPATIYLNANGEASITVAMIDNNSFDNCGIASLSLDNTDFTCADVGANTVTLTAVDVNGNSNSATATVTVVDDILPTVQTQPATIYLNANGEASITVAMIDNNSFDNCGIASLSLDNTDFTCADVGANTVTLTAVDVNGNSNSATATVTVVDDIAPTVQTQPATIYLNANGEASITVADIDNSSFDNCGIASLSLNNTDFTCADVGTNTVTLNAVDVNGNSNSATATVTVVDDILPTVQTQPATIYLNANGEASITVADIDNGSFDNCGIASLSLDNTDFTCADVGANTVTLTAVDVNGNSNSATATVTVVDDIAPTVQTQPATIYLNANGEASITVADIDNSSFDNCGIASLSLDNTDFTCADVGTNTVTLNAVDVNGNSNSATATVTVIDNIAPTVQTQPATIYLNANGEASITVADIDNSSFDNCGIASLSLNNTDFTCADVGTNTVTLNAVDGNGNSNSATATVTVVDDILPTVQTQPATIYLNANGEASITVADIDNGSV